MIEIGLFLRRERGWAPHPFNGASVACRRMFATGVFYFILVIAIASGSDEIIAAEADYDTLIQQSLQLRNDGDFEAAEAVLRQAYVIPTEVNEVAYLLAMVLAFQEKFIEADELLDEALERYPLDLQLILAKARVLSYQGVYGESIDVANTILERLPENTEARNLLGRVYYYQRRYSQAREAFTTILLREPDNLEALIGLYDTENAAGNESEADKLLDRADLVAPGHIDIVSRRDRNVLPVGPKHQIFTGFNVSDFDQAILDQWYDRSLEYRYSSDSGNQVYLRGEHSHRFGAHDSLLEVGAVLKRSDSLLFELAVAQTTDDNDFSPERRVRIGTTFSLWNASENFGSSTLGLSLTDSEYLTGDVQWLKVDLTHYFLGFNGWFTPGISVVEDEFGDRTVGWNMGLHWQKNARLRLGYNYTDAPETENSITTETQSNHLYAVYDLADALSLRLDLSRIERQNSYTRETAAVTLQFRF